MNLWSFWPDRYCWLNESRKIVYPYSKHCPTSDKLIPFKGEKESFFFFFFFFFFFSINIPPQHCFSCLSQNLLYWNFIFFHFGVFKFFSLDFIFAPHGLFRCVFSFLVSGDPFLLSFCYWFLVWFYRDWGINSAWSSSFQFVGLFYGLGYGLSWYIFHGVCKEWGSAIIG